MKAIIFKLLYQSIGEPPQGLKKDKVVYTLSQICIPDWRQLQDRRDSKRIATNHWRSTLGGNYKDYLDYLSYQGFIEVYPSYEVGTYPKAYKIHEDYISTPEIVEINDFCLVRACQHKFKKPASQNIPRLDRWVQDTSLVLEPETIGYILSMHNKIGISTQVNPKSLVYDLSLICKIEDGHRYGFRDYTSGRYHSIVSALSRRLRDRLRYKDQKLCEIDIRACQPLISLILMDECFYEESETDKLTFNKLLNLTHLNKSIIKSMKSMKLAFMLHEIQQLSDNQDVRLFKKIVLNGEVYEWIIEAVYQNLGTNITRDEAKESYCYSFYSGISTAIPPEAKEETKQLNMIKKVLKKILPNVFSIFNLFKVVDKSHLAILCQRIESYIIIDRVTKKIPDNTPFWTIHDSIMTLEENTGLIKQLIEDVFFEVTGLNPIIRIK